MRHCQVSYGANHENQARLPLRARRCARVRAEVQNRHPACHHHARLSRDAARDAEVQGRFPRRRDRAEGLRQSRLPTRRAVVPDHDAGSVIERATARLPQLWPGQSDRDHLRVPDGLALAVPHGEYGEHLRGRLAEPQGRPGLVESPPNTLGLVDDFWFRYVADLGNAGPDKGKGGKFLFLPVAPENPYGWFEGPPASRGIRS